MWLYLCPTHSVVIFISVSRDNAAVDLKFKHLCSQYLSISFY